MLATATTVAIELLFTLVFAASLVAFVRRRDPLNRELVFLFGSVEAIFVLQAVTLVVGPLPARGVAGQVADLAAGQQLMGWLGAALGLLILAQPLFALRLADQIRPIPPWLKATAAAAYVITALPLFLLPRTLLLTLLAVGVFLVIDLIAAGALAAEARRRAGAARSRLATAALATSVFAVAIFVGGASSGSQASPGAIFARIGALVAGIGYTVAFLPPSPLRRVWQGIAAFRSSARLLERDAGVPLEGAIAWRRFVDVAQQITGCAAVAVVGSERDVARVLAWAGEGAGLPGTQNGRWSRQDFDELRADDRYAVERHPATASTIARETATVIKAGLVSVVTWDDQYALILLARHRSLFGSEDRALLRLLGAEAAALAERERMHAEQIRLSRSLAEANLAKSDFIASMSHELRTPLTAILGFSELMRSERLDGDSRVVPAEWIEHIHRSGQHLLALINDVLDLAKVEAGRLELDFVTIDLQNLVGETVAGVRPLAERKQQMLTWDVDVRRLVADRGRVRQILYNLLSNAIKFTPEGGSVSVAATVAGGEVRITVADTGIGIAPADQAAVFDEFRQVGDHRAHHEGTGLGLALTRRLAEAHGGRIELESTPGVGSRFTVVLPARQEPQPVEALPTNQAQRAADTGGDDILIMEDDPSAVRLLRTYIEGDGHTVRVATDGPTGLATARQKPPAAIVLDILMPGMDGWDVLRELKADPLLRDVPVIIVTVVDERGLGLALGAVDYFLKPVDRQALLDRLSKYTFTTKVRQRPVRVLAVDDDPAALDLVDASLRPEGFDVVRASGGREGVERATREPFDLVILDLLMPDLDGFEVVAALRREQSTRELPILILTAHPMRDADRARLNGNILGIVDKGDEGADGLRRWLRRLPLGTPDAA
jgi:signal transduction histidine kinase/CheY-like chemotaxis protein